MATIPELLDGHITLEVECLDRLYLNGYIGKLATGTGLSMFMRFQLGMPVPSPVVLGRVSERFREAVKTQAEREDIPVYQFQHKERKDDIANNYRRQRAVREGIVFIGVAQEKAQAFNGKKVNGQFEFNRDKAVYVNHYYFYIDDEDFGPLFIKVCSYAPWGTKLCLNGHEWAKRQLEKKKIAYEALDNGFLSCADPVKLQQICDSLGPEDIDRVFRKWLRRIPLPLQPKDREAGYDWDLSIWQMEVSLTQIFDRPLRGREFFEEIIRDNLDLGRPDRVQLIFDRVVTKKTPGEFKTRVIQEGVHPSLHINYKNFDLKQYFKEGRGCRTEGTFRNPNDFGVNKGFVESAVLAENRPADQSALAGSRTRQPQQRLERRQHPTSGATCRDRRRQKGAGSEVRPTASDGAADGADHVSSPHRWLSQSRSQAASGRPAGRDSGRVHAPPDDLRPAATSAEGTDLPSTENQSLLRHSVRLEGCPAVLPTGCSCVPPGDGYVHRQRCRSTVSASAVLGPRRLTARCTDLRGFSTSEDRLKT